MNTPRRAMGALFGLALASGCSGFASNPRPAALHLSTPVSISPALIPPAPMAHTAILPAGTMTVKLQSAIQGTNWTQIPGIASFAAAAPDGSLWVLSTAPAGNDKYIWHYANGTWTNISGLASRLSVAPNGTLYAINSGGGTYSYSGGTWTALGGGASDVTAAADGSFYVLSNGNSAGSDQAIWHHTTGWSQVPGAGVKIAASWDGGNYTLSNGTVGPGGLYILNSIGNIYHENTDNTFVQLPGNASAIAPTTIGGVFVLGYPFNASGDTIYYYDLSTPGWNAQNGSGVSISTDSVNLYAIGSSGGIYVSPIVGKNAAQINAAMQSVENYYQALPHQDLQADLQNTAAFASTQGGFASAQADPAGVSAALANGALAYFFADKGLYSTGQAAATPPTVIQGGSPHEIAFLEYDYRDPAFVPSRQIAYAAAFAPAGYPTATYRAEEGSASLDNVAALQNGGVDFLDISTHGGVYRKPSGSQYILLSTTPVTAANMQKWSADLQSGNLIYGLPLYPSGYLALATFAFTPAFITSHVTFNPGAIVDNISCFGENPLIATSVQNTFFAANVGMYYGWTKSVRGVDSDDSDAFLLDRTLGEQSPSVSGLATYVTQRSPAQRPFSLFETYAQMLSEVRNDPLIGSSDNYVTSTPVNSQSAQSNMLFPPSADGPVAHFIEVPSPSLAAGAPIPANGIIEYGRPSIAYMTVDETTTPATLTINGEFPATQGQVTMSSSSAGGASGSALNVTSWTQTAITAQLSDEGATAAGYVTVTSGGVPSNPVPLTQWSGTLNVSETDQIESGPFDTPPYAISGSGNAKATFTIHFRADVHSFYGGPDSGPPYPTNFAFTPEKDSTGTWGPINGSATISQPSYTLTFGVGSSTTLMTQNPGGSNFALGSIVSGNGPQHGCNGGVQGPTDTLSYWAISCIAFSASQPNGDKVSCSDSMGGNVCLNEIGPTNPFLGSGGFETIQYGVLDAIHFVLDSNYNVSAITNIPSTDPNPSNLVRAKSSSTSYTFSFGAPVAPPIQGTTPATTTRHILRK